MVNRHRRSLWLAGFVSLLTLEVALGVRETTLFWALNAAAGLTLGAAMTLSLRRLADSIDRWSAVAGEHGRARGGGAGEADLPKNAGAEPKNDGAESETAGREEERPFFRDDPNITGINEIFPYARYDRSRPFD
ncbi:hypothetical protein MO973_19335 [Paenibacillus sp. TRM 82003]|nr:hypothetical protein [Paenibacillus sp. TRM 82003]